MLTGDKEFEETIIHYKEGDQLYMFTDGYVDQFGGEKEKKFSSKRLRELFTEINHLPIKEQKEMLANSIKNWQGTLEQVDDILVIGVGF
jgi:serine phosphatase RsbU (regulator of sigma subunit)